MKSFLLTVTCTLLTAAGIIALTRFFHPATFAPPIVIILLALFAAASVLYLWRHE